ncbi:glycosyltransferase [Bacillus sp. J37]|uniref:glycosyltransferase n=1 Tax=Bacillus sp. J37 TaxID=935837 RepID=UPI00047B8B41|nr:glycosyltransferase [Bacillus sp. J37]
MNILMLLYKDIHYDARVQREALALAEAGYKVTIACVKEYFEDPPTINSNINYVRIAISVKSAKQKLDIQEGSPGQGKVSLLKGALLKAVRHPFIKLLKDYLAYYEFYKKVKASVEISSFAAIHCHDLNTLWQGILLSKKNKHLRVLYDSHELFNEMAGRNEVDRSVGYFVEKRLFSKIDHFITVNSFMLQQFQVNYKDKPSTIIQNIPISLEERIENSPENYWRSKYPIRETDVVLLYQGGLNPHRGIEECIMALKVLPNKFKMVLMGQGRFVGELRDIVKNLNLQDRVFFHDQVPAKDVLFYTKQADIGLVMYRNTSKNNYYSTPNKIFEYLQAEIPTVASKHPGKSYIVEEYGTGVCVEETPKAIADGVLEIEKNRKQYIMNCKNHKDDLTWDNEKVKLVSLYNRLLNNQQLGDLT